jgi:hypothetical protein
MCALLAGTLAARLEAQVQDCAERMGPIADGRLQHAIDKLKTANPGLEFQPDEHPCLQVRESFKRRAPGDLAALEAALKRRTPHKLAIEANTSYGAFVGGESLVLMTSSGVGSDANSKLFRQIQQTF